MAIFLPYRQQLQSSSMMSSSMSPIRRFSSLLQLCVLLFFILSMVKSANSSPSRRTSSSAALIHDDDATIKSEVIDINNQTILNMFNLTSDQIKRMSSGGAATKTGSTVVSRDSQRFMNIKEHRLDDIKTKIQLAIQGYHGGTDENPAHPQHEMAAYPICNSETYESTWQHDNNVTIRFSDSLFEPKSNNLNLDSAILRLYKINPDRTDESAAAPASSLSPASTSSSKGGKNCPEPNVDSQIRVTVSIVQQIRRNKRAEKKKRICNTVMMNVSQTGWVEIDIKRAIYLWESIEQHHQQQQQQQQQGRLPILVGWLLIEVHDEEERPLKPGLYFNPPKCDQADYAIPWNFYRLNQAVPSSFTDRVPRSPRLDVKLVGYGSFHPATQRTTHSQYQQSNFNSDRNREIYHLTQNSAEESSTTSLTPTDNLLESSASTELVHKHRKRHSHRHHNHHHHHHNNNNTNQHQQREQEREQDQHDSQQQQDQDISSIEDNEHEKKLDC